MYLPKRALYAILPIELLSRDKDDDMTVGRGSNKKFSTMMREKYSATISKICNINYSSKD